MNFLQALKDMLRRGEEPHYIVKNINKPPKVKAFKKRGKGYTHKDKTISKTRRKMAQASRRRNR